MSGSDGITRPENMRRNEELEPGGASAGAKRALAAADGAPAYRPTNDDGPHVALFLLAASICLFWAGIDRLLSGSGGARAVHLTCLALAGLSAGSVVLEVRLVVRRARLLAGALCGLACVVAVVALARHGGAAPMLCGAIGAGVAAWAIIMMRGPLWLGYVQSL